MESKNHEELQLELARLLQKHRDPEALNRVAEVLQQAESLDAKIDAIRRIDEQGSGQVAEPEEAADREKMPAHNRAEDPSTGAVDRGGGESENGSATKTGGVKRISRSDSRRTAEKKRDEDEEISSPILSRRELKTSQLSVKQNPLSNRLLTYLFTDYRKIRDYVSAAGTMKPAFLFRLVVERGLRDHFSRQLVQNAVVGLNGRLEVVLAEDWLYLTKHEYNVVAMLKRLCESLINVNPGFPGKDAGRNLIALASVEIHFLCLKSLGAEQLFDILAKIRDRHPEFQKKNANIVRTAMLLLDEKLMKPSLQQMLLSFNMVVYRKYLSIQDIISPEPGTLISPYDFDADARILAKIQRYIKKIEEEIIPIHKEYKKILKLKQMIPGEEDDDSSASAGGGVDYRQLKYLYEFSGEADTSRQIFSRDSENVLLFTQRLVQKYLREYSPLLTGKLQLELSETGERHRARIFQPRLFEPILERIKYSLEQLDRLAIKFHSLPRDRYLKLKHEKKGGTEYESEVIHVTDDLMASVTTVANLLSKAYAATSVPVTAQSENNPLDSHDIQSAGRAAPYGNYRIVHEGFFNQKLPREAMYEAAGISYLAAIFMHEETTRKQLQQFSRLRGRLHSMIASLDRLANPEQFNVSVRKLNLEALTELKSVKPR